MAPVFFRVGTEACPAGPLFEFGMAADDGEVAFVHAAGFEEFAVGADCAGAFAEEKDASGFGIETVDITEEAEVAGASPECTPQNGGGDGELKVAAGFVPVVRDEHPAGGFVNGEDGAVFVKDGNSGAIGEDDMVRTAGGGWTRHVESLRKKSGMDRNKENAGAVGRLSAFAPQLFQHWIVITG